MQSFILVGVGDLSYAISLEQVQRILPAQVLTPMSGKNPVVKGVTTFENEVMSVICLRSMIGLEPYEELLKERFNLVIDQHVEWMEALKVSVDQQVEFTKTTDPHACVLGKWIDSFSPLDTQLMKKHTQLNKTHQALHKSAVEICAIKDTDHDEAKRIFDERVKDIFHDTLSYIEQIALETKLISAETQKMVVINFKDIRFAILVDKIDNIIHVQESEIKRSNALEKDEKYMKIDGVVEYKKDLISIIESIKTQEIGI